MPTVNLTTAFIRAIKPPPSGRLDYSDERTPGLCLRVSASGAASWSYRYRPRQGAGVQRVTLGNLSELTLSEARDRAARYRAEVIDGGDPQRTRVERRVAARTALTFDDLCQRYLDGYAKVRKKSWRADETFLKRCRERLGDRAADAITRRDIVLLLDDIAATAPVSANRTQTILSKMFAWSVESELLRSSPVVGLRKRGVETPKDRTLDDDEIRLLWAALEPPTISRDVADALKLILLTGQRPGEVAGMQRDELAAIDRPDEARWEIPAARMKAGRPQVVPLLPRARQIVLEALARREIDGRGNAVLASKFTARDGIARHSLSQGMKRVITGLEACGAGAAAVLRLQANPPTPHDLRRTVGTGIARLGVPREDRKAVLAHIETDVHARHYDRYERLREKRASLKIWEDHLHSTLERIDAHSTIAN